MTDERIAALFAGETAALAAVVRLLVSKGVITDTEIRDVLHDVLAEHTASGADEASAATTKHLLKILSSPPPQARPQ